MRNWALSLHFPKAIPVAAGMFLLLIFLKQETTFASSAPPPLGETIQVQGTVLSSANGSPLYSSVICFEWDTARIVSAVRTDAGRFEIDVSPGTYGFYVRAFGAKPIEEGPVTIEHNIQREFQIDTAAPRSVPDYLKARGFSELGVFANTDDAASYILQSSANLGRKVYVYNEFGYLALEGKTLAKIELFDDGTHGDAKADDFLYSRSGLQFRGELQSRKGRIGSASILYARFVDSDQIVHVPSSNLLGVHPGMDEIPSRIGPDAQFTRYAVNIVLQELGEDWHVLAARKFFQYFADDYDFLYSTAVGYDFGSHAGQSYHVHNETSGIGFTPGYDRRSDFGSAGPLKSVIRFRPSSDPPLLHETMHTWANFMSDLFPHQDSCGAHWGYSGVNGILGGFQVTELEKVGPDQYHLPNFPRCGYAGDSRRFSDLELYLAGLRDLPERFSVPVLVEAQPSSEFPDTYKVKDLRWVNKHDITSVYGERMPKVADAQKDFKSAFLVASTRPLRPGSLAALSVLSQGFSGIIDLLAAKSFPAASWNTARMDSRIWPRDMRFYKIPSLEVVQRATGPELHWAQDLGRPPLGFPGLAGVLIERAYNLAPDAEWNWCSPEDFVNSTFAVGSHYPRQFFRLVGVEPLVVDMDKSFNYKPEADEWGLWRSDRPEWIMSQYSQEDLVKEPEYASERPLYGTILFGNSEDNWFTVVIDQVPEQGKIAYFDKNNNEDLTDDGGPVLNQWNEADRNEYFSGDVEFPYEVRDPTTAEKYPRISHLFLRQAEGWLAYSTAGCYLGKVMIGDQEYAAAAYDNINPDGLYREEGIYVDLNHDRRFVQEERFKNFGMIYLPENQVQLVIKHP